MFRVSTKWELDTATYEIPAGTSHPEFVVPSEVTDFIIREYGLADPGMRVIDPFAGNGDFARRIISRGGRCDSIELDPEQYEVALNQLASLLPGTDNINSLAGGEVILGDCTSTVTPVMRLGYFAIYTSIPFTLIHDLARNRSPSGQRQRDVRFARALNMMLNSDGGVLIIDSADHAERNGREYSPVSDTVEYLVNPKSSYPYGHFNLIASHRFNVAQPPEGCDNQFTELVFTKRWPYYPGVLRDLAGVRWG